MNSDMRMPCQYRTEHHVQIQVINLRVNDSD
jgi:hypothetical protein